MGIAQPLPQTPLVCDSDVFTLWRMRVPSIRQLIGNYISMHKRPPALTSTTVFEALKGFEKTAFKRGGLDERTKRDRAETVQLILVCGSLPSGPSPSGILPFDQTAAEIAAYVFPHLSRSQQGRL
jgi:hypothetical protein